MSGICGVVSRTNCLPDLPFITDYLSHLGDRTGGVAVRRENGFWLKIHRLEEGVHFRPQILADVKRDGVSGQSGIGVMSDNAPQPLVSRTKFGPLAIAAAGYMSNLDTIAETLLGEGQGFSENQRGQINLVEVALALIRKEKSIEAGIEAVWKQLNGSLSLLILTPDGLIAARDRLGITSLGLAQKEGSYAIANEDCAFPNLDFRFNRFLKAGEIIRIGQDGISQLRAGGDTLGICGFFYVYASFPTSNHEGVNVDWVRGRLGAALARRDQEAGLDFDIVASIPESGTGCSIGYANQCSQPLQRIFGKYGLTWPRSYPQESGVRDLTTRMKLIINSILVRGKRILACEDSIVGADQLRGQTIAKLWQAGAREIHLRVSCPPLFSPCGFMQPARTVDQLAAIKAIREIESKVPNDLSAYLDSDSDQYRQMVERIRVGLGLTSLVYQRLDDTVEAIGLPANQVCTYCWNKIRPDQR